VEPSQISPAGIPINALRSVRGRAADLVQVLTLAGFAARVNQKRISTGCGRATVAGEYRRFCSGWEKAFVSSDIDTGSEAVGLRSSQAASQSAAREIDRSRQRVDCYGEVVLPHPE
jgi:hypothetical protein